MLTAIFGQTDSDFPPIRITPHGVIPSGLPSDFDTSSGAVIDVAPSAAEEPGPIRLPPLIVTAPKETIVVSKNGMTPTQILGIIATGVGIVGVVIVASSFGNKRRRVFR